MSDKTRKYESDEITVVWDSSRCIHSEKCWRGLGLVFNPKARPWINVANASDDKIMAQIDQCPSGALSYEYHNGANNAAIEDEQIVEVAKNGPLMVYGNIKVKHHDGSESTKNRVTAFCRCGASANKPYCDGSHKKINFEG